MAIFIVTFIVHLEVVVTFTNEHPMGWNGGVIYTIYTKAYCEIQSATFLLEAPQAPVLLCS